jgi:1-acyl-sn-glycerol-3-phosphate acyltransferase
VLIQKYPKCWDKRKAINTDSNKYHFTWFDWFCLWYPPGWLILFNRHWQCYHSDPDGWNWLEYILFLIPGGFYLALFIRWLRLGCRLPRSQEGEFDPNYQNAFREEILRPIVKYYFRGELQQVENLSTSNATSKSTIVAMNHAGMCFPWDFLILGYLLSEKYGWVVQPLANTSLFEHPVIMWWLPPGWSEVLGGVRAKLDDFETAIKAGHAILYAPEGLRGPCKGWVKRYKLQTFDVSFIKLSQLYQIPVLPVICIGNENLHPFAFNFKKLQNLLKMPFLPLSPLIIVFALFPSMGVWAMRTRLRYFIQTSFDFKVCDGALARKEAYSLAQNLRVRMQEGICDLK